jgi:DNA-binding XRE family transcriptional regulator
MSAFDELVEVVRERLASADDIRIVVDKPALPNGFWFLAIIRDDDYVVEVEWQRHRGFGIVAGRELVFGSGVDEIYGSVQGAVARIVELLETGKATSSETPVGLVDLRKLHGLLQKDVAERLGISKSGLAQMERPDSLASMQIDTLRKLISSIGGELVISAHFPEGQERRIAVD